MAKHKPVAKSGSIKNDPLLSGLPGLEFDNLSSEEVIATTDEQKADAFLSRYHESFKKDSDGGAARWTSYFGASVKGEAWEFRELKRFYIQLVVSEKWTEGKFVTVVNSIYAEKQNMGPISLDIRGKMYDQGKLIVQSERGAARRRGRI